MRSVISAIQAKLKPSPRRQALLTLGLGLIALQLFYLNASPIHEDALRSKGLKWSEDEERILKSRVIRTVRPNSLAIERVNRERAARGQAPLPTPKKSQSEFDVVSSSTQNGGSTDSTTNSLSEPTISSTPSQVDNSTLAAFPNIGNQGAQGSCVGWATTYYAMSHEYCLQKGCNNKLGESVFAPRWTYNMINGGQDAGSTFSSAFALLQNHGAALHAELPYSSSDYLSWSTNEEHWRKALFTRMRAVTSIGIGTDSAIANVKQFLANGHVAVIGTYINSWNWRTVQSTTRQGQAIAVYVNGTQGAHAMTIVGYDDNIWVDINNNGIQESAEMGAFKIANSWGASWRNSGSAWASYDAFRTQTSVPNFSPSGRQSLAFGSAVYTQDFANAVPRLAARVRISHAKRNQISMQFGVSSSTSTSPQTLISTSAIRNQGGAFAFNGSTTEIESSFYFDVSSLWTASSLDQHRFYLRATDSTGGSAFTVRSFEIVDPAVGNTLAAAFGVPVFPDASTSQLSATSGSAPAPSPSPTPAPSPSPTPSPTPTPNTDSEAPTAPTQLTSQVEKTTVQKGKRISTTVTVRLAWSSSTDNVAVTAYRVWRDGVLIGTVSGSATSLQFADSNVRVGRTYRYRVDAVDAAGNASAKSNEVTAQP